MSENPGAVVRPFVVSAGRTRPVRAELDLRLETLVSAVPAGLYAPLGFEHRRIVELCQYPRSVAEIAALLPVPLGVARVLISDLAAGELVRIHTRTAGTAADDRPSVTLLERIRDGLLRL